MPYIEQILRPGVLVARVDNDFRTLVTEHFQQLLEKRGDWNDSFYDRAMYFRAGLLTASEQNDFAQQLELIQSRENWEEGYNPQSQLIDLMSAWVTIFETNNEHLFHDDNFVQNMTTLLTECSNYAGEDFVAFEMLFQTHLGYLREREETRTLMQTVEEQIDTKIKEFIKKTEYKGQLKILFLESIGTYSGNTASTGTFTSELVLFLYKPNLEKAENLLKNVSSVGGVGYSPAASAAALIYATKSGICEDDPRLTSINEYLAGVRADYNNQEIPNLHPIDSSSYLWNILSFFLVDLMDYVPTETLLDIYNRIDKGPDGVPWANGHTLNDLDDTALAVAVRAHLSAMGVETNQIENNGFDIYALDNFKDEKFYCYPSESSPSMGSILHLVKALEAVIESGENMPADQVEKAKVFLEVAAKQVRDYGESYLTSLDSAVGEMNLQDKWHVSQFYLFRAILASKTVCEDTQNTEFVNAILLKLLASETSNLEEDSYVASGLVNYLRNVPAERQCYMDGIYAKLKSLKTNMYNTIAIEGIVPQKLWISKNVYSAKFQIVAAIIAAYILLEEKVDFDAQLLRFQ